MNRLKEGALLDRLFPPKEYKPKTVFFESKDQVDEFAAACIINLVNQKPDATLTLPTGRRVGAMYKKLVEAYRSGKVDFGKVKVFNLDEYWPLPHAHPSSYHHFMRTNFLDHVNVAPQNWHIPDGEAADPYKESRRYLKELGAAKCIDLAVVGIGPGRTCHIGFNEAGSPRNSHVRYVHIAGETAEANVQQFANPAELPAGAITQGIADVMRAKSILLLARGQEKAWGVQRSLTGMVNAEAPASFLRYHPDVTFVLDREAASLLHPQ